MPPTHLGSVMPSVLLRTPSNQVVAAAASTSTTKQLRGPHSCLEGAQTPPESRTTRGESGAIPPHTSTLVCSVSNPISIASATTSAIATMYPHAGGSGRFTPPSGFDSQNTYSSFGSSNPISIASSAIVSAAQSAAGTPTPSTREIRYASTAVAASGSYHLAVPTALYSHRSVSAANDSEDYEHDTASSFQHGLRSQSASPRAMNHQCDSTRLPPSSYRSKREFSSDYKLEASEADEYKLEIDDSSKAMDVDDAAFERCIVPPADQPMADETNTPTEREEAREQETEDQVDELTNAHMHVQRKKRRLGFSVWIDPADDPDNNLLRHLSLSTMQTVPARDKSQRLTILLGDHPLFRTLSPEITRRVHGEFIQEARKEKECLFRRGSHSDVFYLILEGEIECEYEEDGVLTKMVKSMGETIGDLALMQPSTSPQMFTATVVSSTAALCAIDGCIFRYIVQNGMQLRYAQLKSFFQSLPIFSTSDKLPPASLPSEPLSGLGSPSTTRSPQQIADLIDTLIDRAQILEFHENDLILPVGAIRPQSSLGFQENTSAIVVASHQQPQQSSAQSVVSVDPMDDLLSPSASPPAVIPIRSPRSSTMDMPVRRLTIQPHHRPHQASWGGSESSMLLSSSAPRHNYLPASSPLRTLRRSSSAKGAEMRRAADAAVNGVNSSSNNSSSSFKPSRSSAHQTLHSLVPSDNVASPFHSTSVFLVKEGLVEVARRDVTAATEEMKVQKRIVREGELFGGEILSCSHQLLDAAVPSNQAVPLREAYSPLLGATTPVSSTSACPSPLSRTRTTPFRKRSRRQSITAATMYSGSSGAVGDEEVNHDDYMDGSSTVSTSSSVLFGISPLLSSVTASVPSTSVYSPMESIDASMSLPMQPSESPQSISTLSSLPLLLESPSPLPSPSPAAPSVTQMCDCRGEVRCYSDMALIVAVDARVWREVVGAVM